MRLFTLVRFGQEQHVRDFVSRGLIYMNHITYFKQLEDSGLRGDGDENLTALYQPDDIKLTINGRELKDFAGPISVYTPEEDHQKITHVFCMSHLYEGMEIRSDQKIFDPRVSEFGNSMAIIRNLVEFEKRLTSSLQRLLEKDHIYYADFKPIYYVPYQSHSGPMSAFTKTDLYSWQNEFRIGVSASNALEPIQFEMGSLEDISAFHYMSDFKNTVKQKEDGSHDICF